MPRQQPSLFDTSPWEIDDSQDVMVATVVFAAGPTQPFDYLAPAHLLDKLQPGCRVRVPLGRGNRQVIGYCVGVELRQGVQQRLKPIASLVDSHSLAAPAMLRLTHWIAQRYLCPLGQVLETVIPAGVRGGAGLRKTTLLSVPADVRAGLAALELPKRQAEVMQRLAEAAAPMQPAELAEAVGCTQSPIQALRKKGLIVARTRLMRHNQPVEEAVEQESNLTLNADQQLALDAILSDLEAGLRRPRCCTASPDRARPRSTFRRSSACGASGARRLCWCRKSASRRRPRAVFAPALATWPCCTAT